MKKASKIFITISGKCPVEDGKGYPLEAKEWKPYAPDFNARINHGFARAIGCVGAEMQDFKWTPGVINTNELGQLQVWMSAPESVWDHLASLSRQYNGQAADTLVDNAGLERALQVNLRHYAALHSFGTKIEIALG